ncbi:MAG TPA: glycine cleavage system aminomethyltransferase GcvT, partial [Burkholderiales bacterium]|nr:glycine cleavage system aminomethyltransferase GcvT [Burkholderiales bacterium]
DTTGTLRITPLNRMHRAAGAKMVPFSGWEMPLHYGSQIEEHHAVRRDAGMFDVSHMLAIDVEGRGALHFLRSLVANDAAKLREPGRALYSCMLNAQGGILDDVIVYFFSPERFRIVVNAGTAERDFEWMKAESARRAAELELMPRRDLAIIAVQGPNARHKTWSAHAAIRSATEALPQFGSAEVDAMRVSRTGYTGEDGFEIMLDAQRAESVWERLRAHGVFPAGLGARDTLRLEAGLNLYGQDMDETVTPFECGLRWTVDLTGDRDFIGRAALMARPVSWQRIGLVLLERGMMRAHQPVRCAGGEGQITSGGFSPTLGRSVALARVPTAVDAGTEADVLIRDKWVRARAVKLPFVRNGKSLVGI